MMSNKKITTIEPGNKIHIPSEWATELGLDSLAALEKTESGILVSPCPALTWDDIFADKLMTGQQTSALDLSEVSGDDLLL